MRIHLETGGSANLIRQYTAGRIVVNQDIYTRSLFVQPRHLVADWPPQAFEDLALPHLEQLAWLEPEVVLIGTGSRLRFPPAALFAPLATAGIGWEIMDTGAACRTYNILMGEGRNVAAALLMIEG